MIKKLVVLFAVMMLGLLLIPSVHAVAIGASPAILSFEVPKGSTVEKTLQISTNSETYVNFKLEKSLATGNYITLSSDTGKTKVGEPYNINVKVSVPRKTELGVYNGTISVKTISTGDLGGGSGSIISTGVTVKSSINVVPATSIGLGTPLIVTLIMIAIIGAAWFAFKKRKPQQ